MRSTTELDGWLATLRARTDAALAAFGAEARRRWPGGVGDAITYALAGEGKRLRPALLWAGYEASSGAGDPAVLAAAIETVHTYSLVHDDLPCMDDDAMRRGRPTLHLAFSVPVAVEAGFRMVELAAWGVGQAAGTLGLPAARTATLTETLFRGAGVAGMIGGQVLDLEAESRTLGLDALTAVHRAKTGALLTASVLMGGLAAGAASGTLKALEAYGSAVGLAFQIVDDVLDATATSAQLGKTAGKDRRQGKSTYVALLGLDGARSEAERLVAEAADHLSREDLDGERLAALAGRVLARSS